MSIEQQSLIVHPGGEQPPVDLWSATADTFAGRVHVEWDATAPVTPFGQLAFFIDYLKQAGLFDAWVADCPLWLTSPNAPTKRDLLGTVLLSVLAGHWRYAHITSLRCDPVNPSLLGMAKVASEDSVRRNLEKIDEAKGLAWLQAHLDYTTAPLLGEPWVLDMDSTITPSSLYTGIRKVPRSATTHTSPAGRRTATTPTCCRACGWCCGSMRCPATNITLATRRRGCGRCWTTWDRAASQPCCAVTSPGASNR
jgi:hypothetical protein